jgi:hypothetical protein
MRSAEVSEALPKSMTPQDVEHRPKTPVLLLVLVETVRLRWFVAGIGLDGVTLPLLCSEAGDLEKYRGLDFDEQVAFLRHRFCGVLQRGCDRLWARQSKACQFVFVLEGRFPEAAGDLTAAVAEHFVQWLLNPPVAVFVSGNGFDVPAGPLLERLAGDLEPRLAGLLHARVAEVLAARHDPNAWALARHQGAWCS